MRLGNSSMGFDLRPDRGDVEILQLVADHDRALRVADRDVLKVPLATAGGKRPARRRLRPRGSPWRRVEALPISTAQVSSEVIVGTIGPASVRIEKVSSSVQPLAAQIEDRLARPVARQLGLRAVGVEDPQVGDEGRGPRCARAAGSRLPRSEMGVAEPPGSAARSAPREAASPRGSGSRCRAPATSRIFTARGSLLAKRGDDLGRHLGVAALGAVDRGEPSPSSASRSAGGGRSCASASSSARRRRPAARRSRAPCARSETAPRASARRTSSRRSAGDNRLGSRVDPLVELARGPSLARRSRVGCRVSADQSSESSVPGGTLTSDSSARAARR